MRAARVVGGCEGCEGCEAGLLELSQLTTVATEGGIFVVCWEGPTASDRKLVVVGGGRSPTFIAPSSCPFSALARAASNRSLNGSSVESSLRI